MAKSLGKILVVDDEVELKNILVEALTSQGYETSGFSSGEEALAALRLETFDVLLTDLMMPGMDGIALVREALQIDPYLVAIMMTGQGTIQTAVDAMKAGTFDYVLKPFRLQSVMPALTRAMTTRHLRLENVQLREAIGIHELSETIAFTLDPHTVLSKLADGALLQSQADEVSVLLPTADGDELYVAVVRGAKRERLLGERIPFGESISSWVARQRTPVLLDGEVDDDRFVALWPRPDIRSSISIPMLVAQKLVGVLNLNVLDKPRPFTLGQMKGLTILAGTAAAALESASLYSQVQRAEANYRSIFENAVEGIFQSTPEGHFITVNPAMARILGYDSPEEMTETITDIGQQLYINSADREAAARLQEDRGKLVGFEFQVHRKDGQTIWVSLNQRSVYDEQGHELYREGTIEDVTERKRSEEALRASQQLIEGIINAIPVRVFWKDKNLSYLGCNTILARDAGLSDPKEIIGKDDYQLAWREHAELYRGDDREVIESGHPKLLIEEPLRTPNGDLITLLTSKVPLRDYSGEISGVIGAYFDITERKRTEEALKSSEAEMGALFASMNDLILVLDSEGRYLKVAPTKTLNMYRADAERVGKTLHEIFPTETADLFLNEIRAALESGSTRRIEYSLTIGDGDFWFDGSISPMTESTVVWVARDITERKLAEEERARLAAEIESQRQRLDNIVAAVPGVVWEAWGQPDAANQRINFVSDYVEALLGYTVDEWLSTPNFWLTIVHPDDKEQTGAAAAEAFALGQPETLVFRWLTKDGRSVWVDSSFVVIKDSEGHPVGLRGVNTDVSERKKAEAELHFQKSVLESQTEASLDGILVVSNEQKILSFNQRFIEIWKVPEKVLRASSDEDALNYALDQLDDTDEFLGGVKYLYEHTEEKSRDEIRLKDGRTLDRYSAPITSAQGEYFGRVWFFRDITERKRAEEALRESEEAYRDLVENAHDIIYSHDLEGKYTSVNKAGEVITGYPREEALKLNLINTVAPEDVDKAKEMLRRKLAGERVTAYEMDLIAKDGRRVPVEVNTRLVLKDGIPVAVQGIARDISERKRAEAELRRLAAAVEQTGDSVIITDTDGSIEYVNPAFERITGYSREEVLGQNPRILKSGKTDPAVYRDLWQKITGGEVWVGLLVNRKKDGTQFTERASISAVLDDSGKIAQYIAVKQDTTHEMQLESQLRQAQKMEAIGQLAGGVAHDFNNLLTAINGYTSLALQKLDDENSVKPYLEEVKKAGDRATNLTRQLLAFGRKQILQPVALDLNGVITDMNKMLRRLIGEDIELRAQLAPDLKRTKGDPGQIEQVLVNLVVNARDAMPRGGTMIIETANVQLDQEYARHHVGMQAGNYVMLAVSDTGCGMDEKTRARIFEPFFTTKEKGKGTGLGLSTVYGIVKQSGGSVWVYSESGKGSSFKIYLPELIEAARAAERAVSPEETIPGGKETVLLVEDEEIVRGLTTKILEQAGYHVLAARGGDEALQLCAQQKNKIDLLLTDVVMPGASGKEVADQMTRLMPGLRVLFMSGYTDEAIVHHGVLDSNVEFIQKPFTPFSLSRKVREVLDLQPAGR